jgi:hypothetical protein
VVSRYHPRVHALRGYELALAAVAVCSIASRAEAAELRYEAPSSCQREPEVRAQVAGLIGRSLEDVEGVAFALSVVQNDDAWHVTVRVSASESTARAEARERHIDGAACEEVTDAAAVAVAMAVREHENRTAEAPPPEPSSPATSAPPRGSSPASAAPQDVDATAEDAGPEERGWRWGVGAGLALDAGALPDPALGVQAELHAGVGVLRVGLNGTLFAQQSTRLPNDTRGGEFELVTAGLLACGEPVFGTVTALVCAGAELGSLSGTGVVLDPREGSSGWQALRAEAGAAVALGQGFSLLARAGLTRPFSRQPFVVDMTDEVHRAAALTFRGLLGVELEP